MPKAYEKRKFVEIRNRIIESLERYPKPTDEVAKDLRIARQTAKSHLAYLESLGVVKKSDFKRIDKKLLWTKK